MNERFANVREILSGPPSEETWAALLKELRAWPSFDDKEMGLEYIHAHLETWPDELRALNQLTESPYWRFVRCYHIDRKMRNQTLSRRLMEHEMLELITVLRISVGGNINAVLPAIFCSPKLKQLHTLILEGRSLGWGLEDEVKWIREKYEEAPDAYCQLKKLVLHYVEFAPYQFVGLPDIPNLRGLEEFQLAGLSDLGEGCPVTTTLFSRDAFPQLKRVALRYCLGARAMLDAFWVGPASQHVEVLTIEALRSYTMALECLLEQEAPAALEQLNLIKCHIADETLRALLATEHLKALNLDISECFVSNEGVQMIEKAQRQEGYVGPDFVL